MYCWNLAGGRKSQILLGPIRAKKCTDGGLGLLDLTELNNPTSFGTCPIKQDLCQFDLAGRFE
jgi:hypothetical protein